MKSVNHYKIRNLDQQMYVHGSMCESNCLQICCQEFLGMLLENLLYISSYMIHEHHKHTNHLACHL